MDAEDPRAELDYLAGRIAALRADLDGRDPLHPQADATARALQQAQWRHAIARRRLAQLAARRLTADELRAEIAAIDAELRPSSGPAAYDRVNPGEHSHRARLRSLRRNLAAILTETPA